MQYEQWISHRYATAKKSRFLSFLNIVSIAGVAVGVMALIVVIGIMTGFGNNLREKIIGTSPHVMIEKEVGVREFEAVIQKIIAVDGVVAASPYVQGSVFLENSGQAMTLVARGVDMAREDAITRIRTYVVKGSSTEVPEDGVMIGSELARYFGFVPGSEITLIAPGSGISGQGWRYTLRVAGIFTTGMADYDMNLIVLPLRKAQAIFSLDEHTATGIGVRLANPTQAQTVKKELHAVLGYSFLIRTWIDINRNLFEALFLEKWGLFLILTLMVLVASFNIVSTLIVTVMSKVHDIGILQSIGVPQRSIRRIFMRQGMYIGLVGTAWGVALGVGISYILRTYVKVPAQIYSIDRVPVELQLTDMAAIIAAAILITFLSTIYPATVASRLQPVEALRYE